METGDLCADTAPTPKSKVCHDPGAVSDTCGVTTYQGTPFSNYMSYTGTMNAHLLLSLTVDVLSAILERMNDPQNKLITWHCRIYTVQYYNSDEIDLLHPN